MTRPLTQGEVDFRFALEAALAAAHDAPLTDRVRIYRGVAIGLGDGEQAELLLRLAAELEAANQRCFEFARQFSRETTGGRR